MLLFELTGVKHLYQKTWDDILKILESKGIKFIGGGKYGSVFSHDSWDYVLKVVTNDPHYLAFVDWAIAHPSKHFPKFAKKPLQMHTFHRRDKGSASRMWVIKIEKLYPITDKNLLEFLVRELEHCAVAAWRKNDGRDITDKNPNYSQLMPDGSVEKICLTGIHGLKALG
jgi:hypothetical protein